MLTYLILCVGTLCYLLTVGIARTAFNNHFSKACYRNRHDADCFHSAGSVIAALVWPLAFPILIGSQLPHYRWIPRAERKRTQELADAEHKIVIAKKNAEAVAIAERSVNIR